MFTNKTEAASTYITLWPAGEARPTASNLSLDPGQIAPNLVMTGVGSGGWTNSYNNAGNTDVVVDIVGSHT